MLNRGVLLTDTMTLFMNITEELSDSIPGVSPTNNVRWLASNEGQSNHYPSNINASVLNTLYRFMSHVKKPPPKQQTVSKYAVRT